MAESEFIENHSDSSPNIHQIVTLKFPEEELVNLVKQCFYCVIKNAAIEIKKLYSASTLEDSEDQNEYNEKALEENKFNDNPKSIDKSEDFANILLTVSEELMTSNTFTSLNDYVEKSLNISTDKSKNEYRGIEQKLQNSDGNSIIKFESNDTFFSINELLEQLYNNQSEKVNQNNLLTEQIEQQFLESTNILKTDIKNEIKRHKGVKKYLHWKKQEIKDEIQNVVTIFNEDRERYLCVIEDRILELKKLNENYQKLLYTYRLKQDYIETLKKQRNYDVLDKFITFQD